MLALPESSVPLGEGPGRCLGSGPLQRGRAGGQLWGSQRSPRAVWGPRGVLSPGPVAPDLLHGHGWEGGGYGQESACAWARKGSLAGSSPCKLLPTSPLPPPPTLTLPRKPGIQVQRHQVVMMHRAASKFWLLFC